MSRNRGRGRRGKSPRKRAQHMPTIGLALMVRNHAEDLPRLLDSIVGAFDHIALSVDSASTDGTADLFRDWARRHGQRHTVDARFEWCDDFAAKRNYTQGLLTTDWTCWADADDTIEPAGVLRLLAATAPRDVVGFAFPYDYLFVGPESKPLMFLRERLVRRGAGTWVGRTHETQVIEGRVVYCGDARWVHHDQRDPGSPTRDRAIVEAWCRDEPDNHLIGAARVAWDTGCQEAFDRCLWAAIGRERQRVASGLREPWTIDDIGAEAS